MQHEAPIDYCHFCKFERWVFGSEKHRVICNYLFIYATNLSKYKKHRGTILIIIAIGTKQCFVVSSNWCTVHLYLPKHWSCWTPQETARTTRNICADTNYSFSNPNPNSTPNPKPKANSNPTPNPCSFSQFLSYIPLQCLCLQSLVVPSSFVLLKKKIFYSEFLTACLCIRLKTPSVHPYYNRE